VNPPEQPKQPDRSPQYVTIEPAVETDTAMPLRIAKAVTIQPAVEIDTAMPLQVAIAPSVVLAYAVVTHDGYHLAADHHDLIAYGTELALVLGVIFVGGRLVAGRLFRSA
jgi:hypothetical protein